MFASPEYNSHWELELPSQHVEENIITRTWRMISSRYG
ncbi:hypothetical protein PC116_g6542 [Phytophthora cactorum]|nr:hypothetical protein PC116_g6542 [Phytophthora cactorum]